MGIRYVTFFSSFYAELGPGGAPKLSIILNYLRAAFLTIHYFILCRTLKMSRERSWRESGSAGFVTTMLVGSSAWLGSLVLLITVPV